MDLFPEFENKIESEWKCMPEFVSEDRRPYQQIKISFRCYDDVKDFANMLGLSVTPKTDALWFPKKEKETGLVYKSKLWGDGII